VDTPQSQAAAQAARDKAEEEDRLRRDNEAMMRGLRGRTALLSKAGETGYPSLGGGGVGSLIPGGGS